MSVKFQSEGMQDHQWLSFSKKDAVAPNSKYLSWIGQWKVSWKFSDEMELCKIQLKKNAVTRSNRDLESSGLRNRR